MAGDTDLDRDDQDLAETFDETNITRDGRDISHLDMARDVPDLTSAPEDSADEETADEDFDPDTADDSEMDVLMERDEGVDEPRSFLADNADRVATDDPRPADFESSRLTDDDLEELGYEAEPDRREADPHVDEQLDQGLKETFPASDPVSINPGAD